MRLDKYLAGHGFESRTKAARALEKGRVLVNGKAGRAAQEVSEADRIEILEEPITFVSEGGFKLYKALQDFSESVQGLTCIDLGASTGGFTDCLLKNGAGRVYAVDVGGSQLNASLSKDPRVCVMDRRNARYLSKEDFPEQADAVTADLSFISLEYILPVIADLLEKDGKAYVLIKPQFECGGKGQDKHGIVKDKKLHETIVVRVCETAEKLGLAPQKLTNAPLRERKNTEYVLLLKKGGRSTDIAKLLRAVRDPC